MADKHTSETGYFSLKEKGRLHSQATWLHVNRAPGGYRRHCIIDGVEYHKWVDRRTMDLALLRPPYEHVNPDYASVTHEGNEDLEWLQRGIWGFAP